MAGTSRAAIGDYNQSGLEALARRLATSHDDSAAATDEDAPR
jgi:hypothetical protein